MGLLLGDRGVGGRHESPRMRPPVDFAEIRAARVQERARRCRLLMRQSSRRPPPITRHQQQNQHKSTACKDPTAAPATHRPPLPHGGFALDHLLAASGGQERRSRSRFLSERGKGRLPIQAPRRMTTNQPDSTTSHPRTPSRTGDRSPATRGRAPRHSSRRVHRRPPVPDLTSVDEPSGDDQRSATGADRPSSGTRPDNGGAASAEPGRLRLIAPAEPPRLTPYAARALLSLMLEVRARRAADHSDEETGR